MKVLRQEINNAPYRGCEKMGGVGLEPTTNALKGRCSTIELPTRQGSVVSNAIPPMLQGEMFFA